MRATIYIPNLNGSARLSLLLDSLAAQTAACRVVLVDNASEDDSVAMARSRFPGTTVVALERNFGFGPALNRAIAQHGGDPLILLNTDVRCEPDFVEQMLAALVPGVDMVAGTLLKERSPELIDSAGVIADRRTLMAFDYMNGLPVASLAGAPPPLAPSGGAALYRRAAFEGVGGFDERIFAYYEDLDLGLRLRAAGGRCALAHLARARHGYSATLGHDPGAKYALTGWSRGYMLRRYGVMARPGGAARTLLCEGAICAGQIVLDRTLRGVTGRWRGWSEASGLPTRQLPGDDMPEVPLANSLNRRLRRRPDARRRDRS